MEKAVNCKLGRRGPQMSEITRNCEGNKIFYSFINKTRKRKLRIEPFKIHVWVRSGVEETTQHLEDSGNQFLVGKKKKKKAAFEIRKRFCRLNMKLMLLKNIGNLWGMASCPGSDTLSTMIGKNRQTRYTY